MLYDTFFRVEESEQFTFYRVPKTLMTNPKYKLISAEAKLLYGLLLDRMGLSVKNGWCDDNGLVFIYFTIEETMEYLGCGHDKAAKLFSELEKVELLERRKQGQGKPAIIYVKKFISDIGKSEVKKSENSKSRNLSFRSQNIGKLDANNTEINNIDFNDTNSSIYLDEVDTIRESIKENIAYDLLVERHPTQKDRIKELVCLMVDTICTTKKTIRISGNDFPKEMVKSRFMKLTDEHIEYVFNSLDNNPLNVRNIRAYLLSALYNAPTTMGNYYQALVNHDLYG